MIWWIVMVQVAKGRSDEGVKACQIHDLLHDLCILESKANKFTEVCTESNIQTLSNPHRLSLLCSIQSYMSSIKYYQSCTHSLFSFAGKEYPNDTLKYFQSVCVLHLAKQAYVKSISSDLETMIHLRYSRIGHNSRYIIVPDCIWSLWNLETLDL